MFKFVDTLAMVLASLVAGVITGIAPELGSYKAFNTALATFLVQAGFALVGTVLLPNLDMALEAVGAAAEHPSPCCAHPPCSRAAAAACSKVHASRRGRGESIPHLHLQVSMLSNLGSQWFLSGASLIAVLQSIKGATYHPGTAAQLEAGRANLAFLSALFSVAGMGLALALKFVDVKEEQRGEVEAEGEEEEEEEESGRKEASLTQLTEPDVKGAVTPAKTFDPRGQADSAPVSATAVPTRAPKTNVASSGGAATREAAKRSSTTSFSRPTLLRTQQQQQQQQRQQQQPFGAGNVRRDSAMACSTGTPVATQSPATDTPSKGLACSQHADAARRGTHEQQYIITAHPALTIAANETVQTAYSIQNGVTHACLGYSSQAAGPAFLQGQDCATAAGVHQYFVNRQPSQASMQQRRKLRHKSSSAAPPPPPPPSTPREASSTPPHVPAPPPPPPSALVPREPPHTPPAEPPPQPPPPVSDDGGPALLSPLPPTQIQPSTPLPPISRLSLPSPGPPTAPPPPACPSFQGYTFFPLADHNGDDLNHCYTPLANVAHYCNMNGACSAFNSEGYTKTASQTVPMSPSAPPLPSYPPLPLPPTPSPYPPPPAPPKVPAFPPASAMNPPPPAASGVVTTAVFCEDEKLALYCQSRGIRVVRAVYGRTNNTACPRPAFPVGSGALSDTSCRLDVAPVVARYCGGASSCSSVSSTTFAADPCGGIFKYTNVTYVCGPPSPPPASLPKAIITLICSSCKGRHPDPPLLPSATFPTASSSLSRSTFRNITHSAGFSDSGPTSLPTPTHSTTPNSTTTTTTTTETDHTASITSTETDHTASITNPCSIPWKFLPTNPKSPPTSILSRRPHQHHPHIIATTTATTVRSGRAPNHTADAAGIAVERVHRRQFNARLQCRVRCSQQQHFPHHQPQQPAQLSFPHRLLRLRCSDITIQKVSRGSVIVEYTTYANATFATITKLQLLSDTKSTLDTTPLGTAYLAKYGIAKLLVAFDPVPPPAPPPPQPPPDLAAQALVVQLQKEATTIKTVTAVTIGGCQRGGFSERGGAAAAASTAASAAVSASAGQAASALAGTASEVGLSTALASAGIENLVTRLQAFVLSGTMVVNVSSRFSNFASALEWLNFQVDLGVTASNSTAAAATSTVYNSKTVSYLTSIANGADPSLAAQAILRAWLHLPFGWCYTPLPDILVFPKLELMVVAATIPGATQLMQQKRKLGLVYVYPQKMPDLSKQSLFKRVVVFSRMHGTWDDPMLALRKDHEPARTRHYCRTHVNVFAILRLLRARESEEEEPAVEVKAGKDVTEVEAFHKEQPLPKGVLLDDVTAQQQQQQPQRGVASAAAAPAAAPAAAAAAAATTCDPMSPHQLLRPSLVLTDEQDTPPESPHHVAEGLAAVRTESKHTEGHTYPAATLGDLQASPNHSHSDSRPTTPFASTRRPKSFRFQSQADCPAMPGSLSMGLSSDSGRAGPVAESDEPFPADIFLSQGLTSPFRTRSLQTDPLPSMSASMRALQRNLTPRKSRHPTHLPSLPNGIRTLSPLRLLEARAAFQARLPGPLVPATETGSASPASESGLRLQAAITKIVSLSRLDAGTERVTKVEGLDEEPGSVTEVEGSDGAMGLSPRQPSQRVQPSAGQGDGAAAGGGLPLPAMPPAGKQNGAWGAVIQGLGLLDKGRQAAESEQAADAQPASTPAPGHDTLWHDEEWEVGEESKWRDRDRLQDEKVAALKVAAAALLKLRSRRAQSEGAGAAGLQQSSSGISRARTISASWWDHIRMGSKVACEGGLRASSLVAASQVEVSICASSKPGSMKDDASAASMSGRRLTACSGDGLPPGSTGRGVDVERGGSARERRAAPATAGSSASEAGVRQLDGKGASAAGLSAPAAAEWGALKQPGQPGRGHGKLTRSAAIKRPLPMVALEIEQRLGDLFTDYRGHSRTTSMFKFADTLAMVLTAAIAGVISGIAPEIGSVRAFHTTIATFLLQAAFALLGSLLLPNLDMLTMMTNLTSQWFLAGASFVAVLQQMDAAANFSPTASIQMQAGRANLAFLSALFSVAGMGLSLMLKFVDVKEERDERKELAEEESEAHVGVPGVSAKMSSP
ncbi:MAG: hypothetical protein WDW36_009624 [Sanguina aurantia]